MSYVNAKHFYYVRQYLGLHAITAALMLFVIMAMYVVMSAHPLHYSQMELRKFLITGPLVAINMLLLSLSTHLILYLVRASNKRQSRQLIVITTND